MKTTVDIPDKVLSEAIKFTRAKTKRDAIVTAVASFNKSKRVEALNARIRGSLTDFMTQDDLKVMREDAKWEAIQ